MNESLQVGPLVLPYPLLLGLSAIAMGAFVGLRLGRRSGLDLEPPLFRMLLITVLVARLSYVWQYREAYFDVPLDILDIRDGGWDVQVGVIAAWAYAFHLIRPHRVLRKPVLSAIGIASAMWLVGSIALLALPHDSPPLPTITLPTFDGSSTSLAAYKGKPTVVNLWATWCPPCQREMPVLQQAQAKHPELHFVFLNQGESSDVVQRFLSSRHLELKNVLLDTKGQASAQFSQSALPTTLFFDAQGHLVGKRIGALSHASLAEQLAALLPHPSNTP